MNARVIDLPAHEIVDWESFHTVFQRTLGFPAFYGRNMNAWIDCLTSADSADDGMSTVTVEPGELLILRIDAAFEFRLRCPEQYEALVECSAFVNFRRIDVGEGPVLGLLFNGRR